MPEPRGDEDGCEDCGGMMSKSGLRPMTADDIARLIVAVHKGRDIGGKADELHGRMKCPMCGKDCSFVATAHGKYISCDCDNWPDGLMWNPEAWKL